MQLQSTVLQFWHAGMDIACVSPIHPKNLFVSHIFHPGSIDKGLHSGNWSSVFVFTYP
jgi:hypothetical protein